MRSKKEGGAVQVKKNRLLLHFDIRNTVLVADSVTNCGTEEAINSYLSSVTWGKENSDTGWC